MSNAIVEIDRESLVEIGTVRIDPTLSPKDRIAAYVRQVRNPYCYLDDGIVVRIAFSETNVTLEQQLLSMLQRTI